jgi:hypothetical protein
MNRTLTVFLCSTFADLGEQRAAVLDAIRKLGLKHDSMEFFGARPGLPIDTCLEEVRKSDLLVVVVGHRYGSLVPDLGLSFSEAEYNEGMRLEKPCLIYLINDDEPVLPKNTERDPENMRRLGAWKANLKQQHTVAQFRSTLDLATSVAADLSRVIDSVATLPTVESDKVGWTVDETRPPKAPTVFLSYAHTDEAIVRRFAEQLRDRSMEVWLDTANLRVGDNIADKIDSALRGSDYVAFFISQSSISSQWNQLEINTAMSRRLGGQFKPTLIPILLDDSNIPPLLRSVKYVDLRDGDTTRAADQLSRKISQEWAQGAGGVLESENSIRAYLLISLQPGASSVEVCSRIGQLPGLVDFTVTYGLADIVAVLGVAEFQQLNTAVRTVRSIAGIRAVDPLVGAT